MTSSEFQQITSELRPALLRVGMEFFGSADDAEDVAQEAMIRLWGFCERMGKPRNVRALAVRIAKNVCVDMRRQQHGALFVALDEEAFVDERNAQTQMEQRETTERLARAMKSLNPRERELLSLRYFRNLPAEEIAQRTGIAKSSVLSMISMAKRKLIQLITPQT